MTFLLKCFPKDMVNHQQVLGGEGLKALLAKFLQKTQELQMLNFTIQG